MRMDLTVQTLALAVERGAFGELPGQVAFLRARPHEILRRWEGRLRCEQPWKPLADRLAAARYTYSAEELTSEEEYDLVLALPGRSREEVLYDFARGLRMLRPGGIFLAALPNDWGAARYAKHLAGVVGPVESLSKHHCRAFWVRKPEDFDMSQVAAWLKNGEPQPLAEAPDFWVQAGLFSAKGIDAGSHALTEHLPRTLSGRVADLGAGWGYLSHFLLSQRPHITSLHLYEADARALTLARRNLAPLHRAGGPSVSFEWHDVTEGLGDALFDAVVMNPPFHTGRDHDPLLGRQFLAVGISALRPGGQLWVVANQFLPYERFLASALSQTRLVWQSRGYKILTGIREHLTEPEEEKLPSLLAKRRSHEREPVRSSHPRRPVRS